MFSRRKAANAGWIACSKYSFIATAKGCRCKLQVYGTVGDGRDDYPVIGVSRVVSTAEDSIFRKVNLIGGES